MNDAEPSTARGVRRGRDAATGGDEGRLQRQRPPPTLGRIFEAITSLGDDAHWFDVVRACARINFSPSCHNDAAKLFRQLSLVVHPDRNRTNLAQATLAQRIVNSAYEGRPQEQPADDEAAATPEGVVMPPWTMSFNAAYTLHSSLRRAEQVARNHIQWLAARHYLPEDFRDVAEDTFIAVYDLVKFEWRTTQVPVDATGRVYFSRVQCLFAPLCVHGEGLDCLGRTSLTLRNLQNFVLTKVAQCFRGTTVDGSTPVTSVAFIVMNALPSIAFVPEDQLHAVADVHLAFDASSDTSSLGLLSHEDARDAVQLSVLGICDACDGLQLPGHGRAVVDLHSSKVASLLTDALRARVATVSRHPSHKPVLDPNRVPVFGALRDNTPGGEHIFVRITSVTKFSDILQFEQNVDAPRAHRREGFKESLLQEFVDFSQLRKNLHGHQVFTIERIIERFASGAPGAILHLDMGFGKTHAMYALTYAFLKVGAIDGATWLLESHAATKVKGGPDASIVAFAEFVGEMGEEAPVNFTKRVRVLKSGSHPSTITSIQNTLRLAQNDEDHLLVIDEASRYLGSFDSPGKVLQEIKNMQSGKVFRVAMTGTPFTSGIMKMCNLFSMIGATFTSSPVACASAVLEDFTIQQCTDTPQGEEGDVAAPPGHVSAMDDLRALLDRMCVGHATIERDDPVLADQVRRMVGHIHIERYVVVFKQNHVDDSVAGAANAVATLDTFSGLVATILNIAGVDKGAFLATLELMPACAFGVYGNEDTKAAYVRLLSHDPDRARELSALTRALLESTRETRRNGEPVLVVCPSDQASVMHFAFHEVRSTVENAEAIAFVDQSTPVAIRLALFSRLNVPLNERNKREDAISMLFVTTETCGFGIDLPHVRHVVSIGSAWVDSTQMQSQSRVGRVCSPSILGVELAAVRFVTLLPICTSSGSNLRRFWRASARGQFSANFFPPVLHADRTPLILKSTFNSVPASTEQRREYHERFGLALSETLFRPDEDIVQHPYNWVIDSMNSLAHSYDAPEFACFMLHGAGGDAADAEGVARRTRRAQERTGGGHSGTGTGSTHDRPTSIEAHRADPAIIFCSRKYAQPPNLGEVAQAAERQAERLAQQFAAEYQLKEVGRAATSLAEAHNGHNNLMLFDTESKLRTQMVFASAWSKAGREYNGGIPFAPCEPVEHGPSVKELIEYGVANEHHAISHVAAKYGFDLINETHVKAFTRIHADEPAVLAGSADAITKSGIVLEIKCIKYRDTFLNHVANKGSAAIDRHYGQVQALLELFNLPVGLLCYWHADINPDDGIPSNAMSYEIPVYRKCNWWVEESKQMKKAIDRRQKALTNVWWDDDIMRTTRPMP